MHPPPRAGIHPLPEWLNKSLCTARDTLRGGLYASARRSGLQRPLRLLRLMHAVGHTVDDPVWLNTMLDIVEEYRATAGGASGGSGARREEAEAAALVAELGGNALLDVGDA
eukprot:364939-Chlamydomonas_euryale.AAC.1